MKILIIDDDRGHRKSLSLILGDAGYEVRSAEDGEEGLEKALAERPQLILCDVRMPKKDGIAFLKEYREAGGDALVLVMTAYGSIELATEAMKVGAYDYLPKPFGADEVLLTIRKAEERENLRKEVGRLRSEVRADRRFGEIVARSPAMIRALEVAGKVARHPSSVLISGASGTGKELVARLIHRESERAEGPFVPVNCGAIPDTLLESEFFGYVRGAFTGADRDRGGLFEAAHGGTLFLDEVGELPTNLQVKLLRALQEGEVRRLGGSESRRVDVRVIAATNRDLESFVQQGDFREDLYYRLAVVPIHLPPLSRRKEEIPDLVYHFLERHRDRLGVKVESVSPEAMEALLGYPWPGNIRELENLLERIAVLADGTEISAADLPEDILHPAPERSPLDFSDDDLSVKRHSAELERVLIQRALERTGGNKTQAADLLELSPRALRYKIRDYGLE
ncbi:MAG: sigma-54 dependent transcriptional regulator [Gemmatimonadota bacterium]